jgi:hypothetical protein
VVYTLEITLQRRIGEHWPVVAERTRPGELLSVRTESTLRSDPNDAEAEIDPLRYGMLLGQSIFHGTILSAFDRAVAESGQWLSSHGPPARPSESVEGASIRTNEPIGLNARLASNVTV